MPLDPFSEGHKIPFSAPTLRIGSPSTSVYSHSLRTSRPTIFNQLHRIAIINLYLNFQRGVVSDCASPAFRDSLVWILHIIEHLFSSCSNRNGQKLYGQLYFDSMSHLFWPPYSGPPLVLHLPGLIFTDPRTSGKNPKIEGTLPGWLNLNPVGFMPPSP